MPVVRRRSTTVNQRPAGRLSDHGIHASTFYRPLFVTFTASAALGARAALQRKYQTHAEWMILHVAAGMPFGWTRVLGAYIKRFYQITGGWPDAPWPAAHAQQATRVRTMCAQ
jgi:hypothetical protein